MDDIQKQAKVLIDKLANPFKPKFKGQGQKLGSSSGGSSSSSTGRGSSTTRGAGPAGQHDQWRKNQADKWQQDRGQTPQLAPKAGSTAPSPPTAAGGHATVGKEQMGGRGKEQMGGRVSSDGRTTPNVGGPRTNVVGSHAPAPNLLMRTEPAPVAAESKPNTARCQCPICHSWFDSEESVSVHVDQCLAGQLDSEIHPAGMGDATHVQPTGKQIGMPQSNGGILPGTFPDIPVADPRKAGDPSEPSDQPTLESDTQIHSEDMSMLHESAALLFSADPPLPTLELLSKLLKNILSAPTNLKFRRIRMTNPKIAELVGGVSGTIEFLISLGFKLQEEGEIGATESWAVMDAPSDRHLSSLREALHVVEAHIPAPLPNPQPPALSEGSVSGPHPIPPPIIPSGLFTKTGGKGEEEEEGGVQEGVLPKKIVKKADRQIRVYFPAPDNVAARIDIPDSHYDRSALELRAEMANRKKQMESSQMLVTRAWREKQAAAAKKVYKATTIRVQMPDMLIVEGVFYPSEPTSHLHEFVAECLLDPAQEFQLVHPFPTRNPFIPSSAPQNGIMPTLEEVELVPAALVKFKPSEFGPGGYTGLRKDLIVDAQSLDTVGQNRQGVRR